MNISEHSTYMYISVSLMSFNLKSTVIRVFKTNLCGLFIVITSKKKDQYDHKSLFQLLVPYNSSSVLSYLNKYFIQSIRLKIHKSISRSAHRTLNFVNPKFQFPQFKVLQSVFFSF